MIDPQWHVFVLGDSCDLQHHTPAVTESGQECVKECSILSV